MLVGIGRREIDTAAWCIAFLYILRLEDDADISDSCFKVDVWAMSGDKGTI